MASIAEFTLPAADFPLGRVFDRWPDATLELDRIVPNEDTVWPYFWVYLSDGDGDLNAVEAAFDDMAELQSAVLIEDMGDKGLFRAEWDPAYMGIVRAIAATGVTVLSATGSADGWTVELRAMDDEQFSRFNDYCSDHDIDVSLTRLSRLSAATTGSAYDLTPEQRAALVEAYREGYYEQPRETDQEALAARLGISRQAFSSRLRRGYRNLIRSTLAPGEERDG
jgi:predicted DNA binding protein